MVPLTQNSLLKLPGASSRLQSLALLPPYRALIALGLGFSLLTGIFVATEQWLALSTAETLHQVGSIYTPPITAGFEAKGRIAKLLIDEADFYRSRSQTPDPHGFDNQKQEIVQPWIDSAEGPNSVTEKATLASEMTALMSIESGLATINNAQASGSTADNFHLLMDGDVRSLLNSADLLETQRAHDLQGVENQNDLDFIYYTFLGVFYMAEALLITTSLLLAFWFRRILNPGVVAAFGIMLVGGGLLQTQLGTSLAHLEKMEQVFISIRNLGKLQSEAAEADLYLHSWFLSHDAADWGQLCTNTSKIYTEDRAPSDGDATPFSVNAITELQFQNTGSGILADEWKTSQPGTVLSSYRNLLKELDQVRVNETQGKHDNSLELLSGPNGLNDSFSALDGSIAQAQTQKMADFEIDRVKAQSNLELTTQICLFTALGQLIAFWLGLIPRLREYMR